MAAEHGYCDILEYLLDKNADPNLVNGGGMTVLMLAVLPESSDAAAILITHGAALDTAIESGPMTLGLTALMFAAERGHTAVIDLLLEHGANLALQLVNSKQTALHRACVGGHPDCVQALLNGGANCLAPDADGLDAIELTAEILAEDPERCQLGRRCGTRSLEQHPWDPEAPLRGACCTHQAVIRVLQQGAIGGCFGENGGLLPVGTAVEVHSLVGAAHHNGKKGVIKAWNATRKRYIVQLHGSPSPTSVAIRLQNLTPEDETCLIS